MTDKTLPHFTPRFSKAASKQDVQPKARDAIMVRARHERGMRSLGKEIRNSFDRPIMLMLADDPFSGETIANLPAALRKAADGTLGDFCESFLAYYKDTILTEMLNAPHMPSNIGVENLHILLGSLDRMAKNKGDASDLTTVGNAETVLKHAAAYFDKKLAEKEEKIDKLSDAYADHVAEHMILARPGASPQIDAYQAVELGENGNRLEAAIVPIETHINGLKKNAREYDAVAAVLSWVEAEFCKFAKKAKKMATAEREAQHQIIGHGDTIPRLLR